jgi:hypothetical protein
LAGQKSIVTWEASDSKQADFYFLAAYNSAYALLEFREGGHKMPTAKEMNIRLADRPGTLGKVCRAMADRGVNILAFQSIALEGESLVRIVPNDPAIAKQVLDSERLKYTETGVALVKLRNRPGELAIAAKKLGDANININYAYCGIDPDSNSPLLVFGVSEVAQAAKVLEQIPLAA